MKKLLIIVSCLLLISNIWAQKTADIGIWAGQGTYFGDMTQMTLGSSLNFDYGAFVRYNFNPRIAARLQVINGTIGAEGMFENNIWAFEKNVTSLSLMAEINFFKYFLGEKETPFTTYLLGGIGIGRYPYDYVYDDGDYPLIGIVPYLDGIPGGNDYNLQNPSSKNPNTLSSGFTEPNVMPIHIPFGFGAKVNLGEKVGAGVEVIFNRYFNDKLDNLDDPRKNYTIVDASVSPYQVEWNTFTDEWHNNDYTVYVGVYLAFKFNLSKKACPVYEYDE